MAGEETFHQHEEQRYEEHRQQGGRQGAADNPGADRHAAVGSGAGGDGQRQHPAINASEVMTIGRRRVCAARIAARESEYPSSTADSANSTIRMAFFDDRPMVVSSATEVDVVA